MMSAGPHHSVPMTQAQINQQHHQQQQANHLAKLRSRKPTDKNLPDGVEEVLSAGSEVGTAYKNLRDLERRLDATMTRKRLDIVDSLSRNAKVCVPGESRQRWPWLTLGTGIVALQDSTHLDQQHCGGPVLAE